MNIPALLTVGLLSVALGSAQTWLSTHPDQWHKIKNETQSDNWQIREAAFNEIHRLGDKRDPEVATVLFALLDREVAYRDKLGWRNPAPEEWMDPYISGLADDCRQIYEGQPSQDRFRTLASIPFNPDSPWAQFLGAQAEANVDWLLDQLKSENPFRREHAASVLGQWIRFKKPPAGPRRAAAVAALDKVLDDPYPPVPVNISYVLSLSKDGELCGIIAKAMTRYRASGKPQDSLMRNYRRCNEK
jgi:hypothetical protein